MNLSETPHLHVAPHGDDRNDGSADRPLATLAGARDAARRLKQAGQTDIHIRIAGGTYRVEEPVVFTPADSALQAGRITYAAVPGQRPVFSAAREVTGWRKLEAAPPHLPAAAAGRVWVAELNRPALRSLFRGEARMPRARGQAFAFKHRPEDDPHPADLTLYVDPADLPAPAALVGAELLCIPTHPWAMDILPFESFDAEAGLLKLSAPCRYDLKPSWHPAAGRGWIENSLAVLDGPGQWVFDPAEGLLYLWPPEDRTPEGILASCGSEILRVEGDIDYDGPADTPVTGLTFRGLTFLHGQRYPWQGRTGRGMQHDWEAFDQPTAMVRFRGAERCAVECCRFAAADSSAVRLDLHARQNRIAGNLIEDVGGCGVALCGYGPGTKDVNTNNVVENNHIHHVGRVYWHSPAVFVWQSGCNRVAHNHIHDTPYAGIVVSGRIVADRKGRGECSRTVRWQEVGDRLDPPAKNPRGQEGAYQDWLAREPLLHARANRVERNDIHDVMQTLGDGNAIYVSGCGAGNTLSGNWLHDCPSPHMAAVIRCDDDQHDTLIEGNVIARNGGMGTGIAIKGVNHLINNVIACPLVEQTKRGLISLELGPIDGSQIQRNVLVANSAGQAFVFQQRLDFYGQGPEPLLECCKADANLYWNTADPAAGQRHIDAERPKGVEANSLAADPGFIDLAGDDYRFTDASPARGLGIAPVDIAPAGIDGDAETFETL